MARTEQGHPVAPKGASCLVITPFDANGVRIKAWVESAISDVGIVLIHYENVDSGALWVNTILSAIKVADLLVVDISSQNPNVMYELGFAHALRKPTILIINSDTMSKPPSDLDGQLFIYYDHKNPRELRNVIMRSAMKFIEKGGG